MRSIKRGASAIAFFLSGFTRRCEKTVVFGSWFGNRFRDNPRYLIEFLSNTRPDLQLIYCSREKQKELSYYFKNIIYVKYGSLRSLYYLLTAGYCFVSHGYQDLFHFNVFRNARVVYLGHGFAVKRLGGSHRDDERFSGLKQLIRKADVFQYFVSSSEEHSKKMLDEFKIHGINRRKIVATGQPRNDFLIRRNEESQTDRIRARYYSDFQVSMAGPIITYMPTFRSCRSSAFSFFDICDSNRERLIDVLDRNRAMIIEKRHPVSSRPRRTNGRDWEGRIVDLSQVQDIDAQELLLISDILVTDYSGCYLDFLLLNRPIIHFAYDYNEYMESDRGLYYGDLAEIAGGLIVASVNELIESLAEALRSPESGELLRSSLRKRFVGYESGSSCRNVADQILGVQ